MRISLRLGSLLPVLALLVGSAALRAQEGSSVVLPPSYDPSIRYPVVVFLPFTGGVGASLLADYAAEATRRVRPAAAPGQALAALIEYVRPGAGGRGGFVAMLACGAGRAEDYRTADAWSVTILRCEDEILADLGAYAARYPLDTTRVVLAGYSMGGDLAWAMTLRNPARFRGAIVMGSRASYRTAALRMAALVARGVRVVLAIGDQEEPVRLTGARAAAALLERHGVAHQIRVIPQIGHDPAPLPEFAEALRFVLGDSPPSPPAAPRSPP